jgi:phosphatidylserine decarboxylase
MMRIAKGGLSWILPSLLIAFLFLVFSFFANGLTRILFLAFFLLFCAVFCLLLIFFRDPTRSIGAGVVAVADGKIREIILLHDPEVGDSTKISTFMNIHNVHVNRIPLDGTIAQITHHTGGHRPAFQKESELNERIVLLIQTGIGMVKVVQIAGTVARRIVPYVRTGDKLKKGEKLGLIRLGSRVDVYLPTKKIKPLAIQVYDTVKAGEDTIAELHD